MITEPVSTTDAELDELIDRDPLAALCAVLDRVVGARLTLYGMPIDQKSLREVCAARVDHRIERASRRGRVHPNEVTEWVDLGGEGGAS